MDNSIFSFELSFLGSFKIGVELPGLDLHTVDNFFRIFEVLFFLWITRIVVHAYYTVIHNSKSTLQGLVQHMQRMVQL